MIPQIATYFQGFLRGAMPVSLMSRASIALLALYAFLLPLVPLAANWVALCLVLVWLIGQPKNWAMLLKPYFYLPILWFLWQCCTLLYAHNTGNDGHFAIEVKLSILLLPIVIGTQPAEITKGYRFILGSFVLGVFFASVICFLIAPPGLSDE